MRSSGLSRMLTVACVAAALAIVAFALPASAAGAAVCSTTTANVVQTMGTPHTPVVVPAVVPVTICTLPNNVQVVIPAFHVVGTRSAPVIRPVSLPEPNCFSTVVVTQPTVLGTAPVLSMSQALASGAVVVNPGSTQILQSPQVLGSGVIVLSTGSAPVVQASQVLGSGIVVLNAASAATVLTPAVTCF